MIGTSVFAQTMTLDQAVQAATREMGQRLPLGSVVAVVGVSGPSEEFSQYVINELTNAIVNDGRLTAVDRQRLGDIMQELQFQDPDSGFVDENTAQEVGRMTGAQYIISGNMDFAGAGYRFRVRVLTLPTAAIAYSYSTNVENDMTIRKLTGEVIPDFTADERSMAKSVNLAFGLGSFAIQKDILGGSIIAVLDVAGITCIIAGLVKAIGPISVPDVQKVEEIKQYGTLRYYEFDGKQYDYWLDADDARDDAIAKERTTGYVLIGVGAGLYAAGSVLGFIRPSLYHRPGSVTQGPLDPAAWDIALVSDIWGDPGLRLTYKMSF
jgi:hypothetical protein